MNKNMISLQKTNSCLLENNTKVLGNDEADVSNQMSRKYKEENISSYPKRFNSLVALILTLRAGSASVKKGSEFEKNINVQQVQDMRKMFAFTYTCLPLL